MGMVASSVACEEIVSFLPRGRSMLRGGDADISSALELFCIVSAGILGASLITFREALFISRSVMKFVLPC